MNNSVMPLGHMSELVSLATFQTLTLEIFQLTYISVFVYTSQKKHDHCNILQPNCKIAHSATPHKDSADIFSCLRCRPHFGPLVLLSYRPYVLAIAKTHPR